MLEEDAEARDRQIIGLATSILEEREKTQAREVEKAARKAAKKTRRARRKAQRAKSEAQKAESETRGRKKWWWPFSWV